MVVPDLATQWIQSYPCKTKTSQETEEILRKFLEPSEKPKVIYTDNSLEFGKPCEDVSWIIELQHLIDPSRVVLFKDRYAEDKKECLLYCCNQAWVKNGRLIIWNACYLRIVQDILGDGKTPYERLFRRAI